MLVRIQLPEHNQGEAMQETGWVKFKDAPLILLQNLYDGSNIMAAGGVDEILEWVTSDQAYYFNDFYFPEPYRSDPRYRKPGR
jgi:hypothetical protein